MGYSTRLAPDSIEGIGYSSPAERSWEGESASSGIVTRSPGTVYSSLTQQPRSMSLQRSEQKGRYGLSCHSAGLLQVGHFIEKGLTANR